MVEIKAGPELDRAVAEVMVGAGNQHKEGWMGPSLPIPFLPSTDLNAAFDAAEAVGLFEKYAISKGGGDGYVVFRDVAYHEDDDEIACEATAALAICAAILAMHESDE